MTKGGRDPDTKIQRGLEKISWSVHVTHDNS